MDRRRDEHQNGNLNCSFCGKSQKEVKKLIAGPTVYICDECIGLCNDIIAEERDETTELSFEENRDAMIRAGVPAPVAEMNAQAFSMTADGDAEWITDDVPAILGRPARSLEQFAADYAPAFS